MSAVNAPFGLRPSFHPSGDITPTMATVTTGYGSNIYQGAPVGFIADGSVALSPAGGTGITGAVGAFQGVEYTDLLGRRNVSNWWPSGTVGTQIVAWITQDPTIIYDIQVNGALTQAAIGAQYDWSANVTGSGSTGTGLSNVTLDNASSAATAGLRVIGLTPGPSNDWSDAFPVVQVQLSEHQFVATINAF